MYVFSNALVQIPILRNGLQNSSILFWKMVTVTLNNTEIMYLCNDLFYPHNQQQHFQRELINIHSVFGIESSETLQISWLHNWGSSGPNDHFRHDTVSSCQCPQSGYREITGCQQFWYIPHWNVQLRPVGISMLVELVHNSCPGVLPRRELTEKTWF